MYWLGAIIGTNVGLLTNGPIRVRVKCRQQTDGRLISTATQIICMFDKHGNYIFPFPHTFWSQPPTMMERVHIDHTKWQTIMQIDPWNPGYETNLNFSSSS